MSLDIGLEEIAIMIGALITVLVLLFFVFQATSKTGRDIVVSALAELPLLHKNARRPRNAPRNKGVFTIEQFALILLGLVTISAIFFITVALFASGSELNVAKVGETVFRWFT